ncbi:cytochrome P450 family protein [Saccharomonospora iraqiensis]|uniref:cytochrome P450 family protein n=1 Tax=Saccharomonospora iraqiensis TaxID=52698 RepID=UPI00022E4CDD|nr:cytochrome P450 [Saccharomonospora iraqiensis]
MTDVVTDEVPVVRLDPTGSDHHGEAARMREAGPVIRAILPGEVTVWAVTRHDLLADLLTDSRVSKDWRNWSAIRRGEISDDWPLIGMVKVTNMVTSDGATHQRLRRPVTKTFTRGRVERMRPDIERIVHGLLDDLPNHAAADGSVDLRQHYAYPVPMNVICELVGVPEPWRPRLRELVDSIFRTDTTPEEVVRTQTDRQRMLKDLVELRTRESGEDLTSALIATREQDAESFTDEELTDTIWLLLTAGHETTLSLLVNGVRALLTHPEQLEAAREGGEQKWSEVIEEVLRWDAPIGNFMARYPLEDITIAGVTIPEGEAIIAPYSGVGRDPEQHGADADRFDSEREQQRHLAFGGGPHICLGAHLARMEAQVALPALFERYPNLKPAADIDTLVPVPSFFSNSASTFPVHLH